MIINQLRRKLIKVFFHSPRAIINLLLINFIIIAFLIGSTLVISRASEFNSGEQYIQSAWTEFVDSFPEESNQSAYEIQEILFDLGFSSFLSDPYLESDDEFPLDVDRELMNSIRDPLSEYVQAQALRDHDGLEQIPEILNNYLIKKEAEIEKLKYYLLLDEMPFWKLSYAVSKEIPDYTFPLPAFLSFMDVQRLLLVSAIKSGNLGNRSEVVASLDASLNLTRAVAMRPDLISQLVSLMGLMQFSNIARKFDFLESDWFKELELPDYYESMIASFKLESFTLSETLKNYFEISPELLGAMDADKSSESSSISLFFPIRMIFHSPFLHLLATDVFLKTEELLDLLSLELVSEGMACYFDSESFVAKVGLEHNSWWNPLDASSLLSGFLNQLNRVTKTLLYWELTEKIIEVKEVVRDTGSFPREILSIDNSKVCPDIRWDYQLEANDRLSLSLIDLPEGIEMRENDPPFRYVLDLDDFLAPSHV